MNEDLPASFADLLDPDYQGHVISAMKEWCDDYRYASGEAYANLVLNGISHPLRVWLHEQWGKSSSHQDIELGLAFRAKVDDIVYILRYKTRPLYPEHVSMLDDAWSAFRHGEDPEKIADRVLHKRRERAAQEKEYKKRVNQENRTLRGAEATRKYDADDVKIWVEAAEKILKLNKGEIKSIRELARRIIKETGCNSAAFETIRREEEIVKIYNKHNLKK